MKLVRAMAELKTLCDKADVRGIPRVSITFDSPRDKAFFEAEVKREQTSGNFTYIEGPWDFGETTIHGIKVRIL